MEVKLNQLSKLKVIFALCSVILLAGCAGGAGDSGDSSDADCSQYDNTTLNCNLELKDSCTIRNLDLNGNVVLVKAKGVVLDGAKNGKVIVDSSVGDGDFTMKNCKGIKNVTVNGGGSNSLHFLNSVIDALVASKENVRLVLEGQSKITNVEVKASGVKLQGSSVSEIAKVSVTRTVASIEVKGGSITNIIAAGKIEVKISSSETKIEYIKSVKDVVVTKDAGVNLESEPAETENDPEVAKEYDKVAEASEIPNTIRIVVDESYTKGIKFDVKNADGSDLVLGNTSLRNEQCFIYVDGDFYTCGAEKTFIIPFVNPGEQVFVKVQYVREEKGSYGEILVGNLIAEDSKIIVPKGGYGIPKVEGELKYTVDKYGNIRISELPHVILKNRNVEYSSLVFDFCDSKDNWLFNYGIGLDGYEREYFQDNKNCYLNGEIFKDGFDNGSIYPYIRCSVKKDADDDSPYYDWSVYMDGELKYFYSGRVHLPEEASRFNFTLLPESEAIAEYVPKPGDILVARYEDSLECYYFESASAGMCYSDTERDDFILRGNKIFNCEDDNEYRYFVKAGDVLYYTKGEIDDDSGYSYYLPYEKVTSFPDWCKNSE